MHRHPKPEKTTCLVQSVADEFAREPSLEAVTFDAAGETISVATLGPVHDADLEKRLAQSIRRARTGREPSCQLLEGKPQCASCESPLPETTLKNFTITRDADKTTIARVTCPTAPRFWKWRDISWPKLTPREVHFHDDEAHLDEWKWQLLAAALCGVFGIAGAMVGGTMGLAFYIAAYVAGAWFAAEEVWELLGEQKLDVHFLMLAVAFGSASIGAWGEGATLLFLFSFSGALEHYAMGRTQREIRSLFKAAPKTAIFLDANGNEREVPVEAVQPGMRLLIRPDTQFAVDAEIVKGRTATDESNLTGESLPVEKGIGDTVLAGTLNLSGLVEVVVVRRASESALQKIIHLIREAQHLKAPAQRFTDKFGTHYTYGVLALSVAMFFVWWLGLGLPAFTSSERTQSAFYRTMTLLVVASPCALVLSIPSAVLAAIAWGARRGILFRGGAAVEKLAQINVVALDKTGTLTTGELRVERVESFPPGREGQIAELAYSIERHSKHPLARAITVFGKQKQLRAMELDHFESVPGVGIQARHGNQTVLLGRREWVLQNNAAATIHAAAPQAQREAEDAANHSEVWLAQDGLLGRILLRDDIRPQAAEVIQKLRDAGLKTLVLTGDRKAVAENLKSTLQLDDVRAELKPDQKVEVINSFTQNKQLVAMVGDGVNDAPSLAAAHVGVAMGARGSDAALEQAEVVLMHDRLENFWSAYQHSQRARRIIHQNLVVSLGTVAVLVTFAMFGAIPLTLGVIGHEGSTVIVVTNSLRLLFGKR